MSIPDSIYAGIGKIVVAWASLEHQMSVVTITMISPDIFTGISLTKELRFRSLCDAMINIFRIHIGEGPEFSELVAIVRRAEQLEIERNKFAHAPIHSHEKEPDKARLRKVSAKRKGIKYLSDPISVLELESLAQNILNVQGDLLALYKRLMFAGRLKYVRVV